MIYLAYITIGFSMLQFLVVLLNYFFKQDLVWFKYNGDKLVSVLIPARNEEKNISHLLGDLQKQNYKNLEILVFNDQSTDGTAEIVQYYEQRDSRIHLLNSEGLPNGWLGKNYACYNLANEASGTYYLFLDADVRIEPDLIEKTIGFFNHYQLKLLSIFPRQTMLSSAEWATVPLMNYILLSLLPLIFVRISPFSSHSAANGQFMLFDAEVYLKVQPHEKMKNNKVEDIAIARHLKKKRLKIACLAEDKYISCRMYSGYNEAIEGFSKNFVSFLGGSYIVAILFFLISCLGWISVLISFNFLIFMCYLSIILLTRILISKVSGQNILKNLVYLIPQQYNMGAIIAASIRKKFQKKLLWKGRNIL